MGRVVTLVNNVRGISTVIYIKDDQAEKELIDFIMNEESLLKEDEHPTYLN
jgi:hypothetical protein